MAAAAPSQPLLAAADVRAFLVAWVDAQNTGNFAAYGALYADHFLGIKRVGTQPSRFEHDTWLTDRKRMFAHPMIVVTSDEVIVAGRGVALVTLVQKFTQGKFHDEGPKQLLVVATPAGLRIAREEMLVSRVGARPSLQGVHLVVDEYVILDPNGSAYSDDGGAATVSLHRLPHVQAAFRGVGDSAVPGVRALAFDVLDTEGHRTAVKVAKLGVLDGRLADDDAPEDFEPAQTYGPTAFAATTDPSVSGIVAVPTGSGSVLASATIDDAGIAAARAAFKATPTVDSYTYAGFDNQLVVHAFEGGGHRYVVVEHDNNGCDEIDNIDAVIFNADRPALAPANLHSGHFVDAIIDVGGTLYAAGHRANRTALWAFTADRFDDEQVVDFPNLDHEICGD